MFNCLTDWSSINANQMGILNSIDNRLLPTQQAYSQINCGDFYGFYPYSYENIGSYQTKLFTSNPETAKFNQSVVSNQVLKSSNAQKTNASAASQNIQYNYNSQATIQVPSSTANSSNFQTFTTQKLSNATTKLSYTPYQLELLNSIYKDMKYPNSVQKTLVAKRIGITRDQVKVSRLLL
jgi:hypothetical protein